MSSIFTYISAIYGLNGGKYSMQGAYEGYPHDVFPQKKTIGPGDPRCTTPGSTLMDP
jgi:hypothetical protein